MYDFHVSDGLGLGKIYFTNRLVLFCTECGRKIQLWKLGFSRRLGMDDDLTQKESSIVVS